MLPGPFYLPLETLPLHNLHSPVQQRLILRPNYPTNDHLESPLNGFVLDPLVVREGSQPWTPLRFHSTLRGVLIYWKKGSDLALSSVRL